MECPSTAEVPQLGQELLLENLLGRSTIKSELFFSGLMESQNICLVDLLYDGKSYITVRIFHWLYFMNGIYDFHLA
jgi:hypothetical protein